MKNEDYPGNGSAFNFRPSAAKLLISALAVLLSTQSKVRFSLADRFRYEGGRHVRQWHPL